MKKITAQKIDSQIIWDEKTNETLLVIKYSDNQIYCTPLTSEEASEWTARLGGY